MESKKTSGANLENLRGLFLSLSLVVSLSLVILAFEWKSTDSHKVLVTNDLTVQDVLLDIPPTLQEPPKPPAVIQPKVVEVPDEEEIEEEIKVVIDISEVELEEKYKPIALEPKVEEVDDEIFVIVETKPEFPGGDAELMKFLFENLKYPSAARRMGIEGKVFVTMVVEKDGTITNPEVMRGFDTSCDNEALRVMNLMPKWIPGKQRGKPVRVKVSFPISFKMGR